ncbi:hypothetical protein D1872_236170 [compost metagenome]
MIPGVFHLGQIQQIIGQPGHPLRFRFDIMQPFRLAGNRILPGRKQHVGICVDDGQRGFQFVRGIGNKLLLLVEGLPNGLNRPIGEIAADKEQGDQHDRTDNRERVYQIGQNALTRSNVQEDQLLSTTHHRPCRKNPSALVQLELSGPLVHG